MYSITIMILICIREYFLMKATRGVFWDAGMRDHMKKAGWVLRAVVTLMAFPDVVMMLIAANLAWTVYDIACALGLNQKWWYLGSTSVSDRMNKWGNYGGKILLLLLLIILILI
jgi:hypothetical protein